MRGDKMYRSLISIDGGHCWYGDGVPRSFDDCIEVLNAELALQRQKGHSPVFRVESEAGRVVYVIAQRFYNDESQTKWWGNIVNADVRINVAETRRTGEIVIDIIPYEDE
jgi:hypothetical protein